MEEIKKMYEEYLKRKISPKGKEIPPEAIKKKERN